VSRPKPRRARRTLITPDPRDTVLRAELECRMDQLRAVIEAKRREGWVVVRATRIESGPPSSPTTT
jgi:hypothetical protein